MKNFIPVAMIKTGNLWRNVHENILHDSSFNDIYYDGENHIYIDGDVLSTGVIPVLMVDTDTDSYYCITDGDCWPLTEYEG